MPGTSSRLMISVRNLEYNNTARKSAHIRADFFCDLFIFLLVLFVKGGMLMSNDNNEIFRQIYDKYANTLYRIAYLHTGSAQESEDILQEVFIKRLYNAPHFTNETHEKAWLLSLIHI